MGGSDFTNYYIGNKDPKAAFQEIVERAIYNYGHSGYSGTIKEKDGFEILTKPDGKDLSDFIDEKMDENDKWGAAYCIELKDKDLKHFKNNDYDEGTRVYVFFGIASS